MTGDTRHVTCGGKVKKKKSFCATVRTHGEFQRLLYAGYFLCRMQIFDFFFSFTVMGKNNIMKEEKNSFEVGMVKKSHYITLHYIKLQYITVQSKPVQYSTVQYLHHHQELTSPTTSTEEDYNTQKVEIQETSESGTVDRRQNDQLFQSLVCFCV